MEAQSQSTVKENPHGPKVIVIYLLPVYHTQKEEPNPCKI